MPDDPATVELRPLAASEIPAAGGLCQHAFRDYPLHVELFPGPADQRADYVRSLYTAIVADCVHHGVTHAAYDDGRLVGVAAWLAPGGYPQSLLRQLRWLPVATTVVRNHRDRIRQALQALWKVEEHHPDEPPHWYLATIAVQPDAQGAGIGRHLVRPILDLTDRVNEPAFLETTSPENRAWYERLGFETIVAVPAFQGGPIQWAMWRDPAG